MIAILIFPHGKKFMHIRQFYDIGCKRIQVNS